MFCGFRSQSTGLLGQKTFDLGITEQLFATLDTLEARLSTQRWVLGDRFTSADIMLFPALWRFDFVYNIHFKCSWRRIQDDPALRGYVKEIYSWPFTKLAEPTPAGLDLRRERRCQRFARRRPKLRAHSPHQIISLRYTTQVELDHPRVQKPARNFLRNITPEDGGYYFPIGTSHTTLGGP